MHHFTTTITLANRPALLPTGGAANRYTCPRGATPGTATVLLTRADVDAILSQDQTFHTLAFRTSGDGAAQVSFPGMVWVGAERLFPGAANDPTAAYVVRLKDRRHLAARFSDTGRLRFNLRSFAQASDYLLETAGYTWSSALEEVWDSMAALWGPFPGLPATVIPATLPENLHLLGTNAWQGLHSLLRQIGCSTVYDPVQDNVQIVDLGAAQVNLPTSTRWLFDDEPSSIAGASLPQTIRVYFPTHYRSHGQQRDTQADNHFLDGAHSTYRDVPTNVTGAVPGTVLPLWDDVPQVLDENNLPQNATQLTAKAAARAQRWLAEHQEPQRRRVYPGLLAVTPGSEVAEVTWKAAGPDRGGTTTEVVFQRSDKTTAMARGGWNDADENFRPPDFARRTTPGFPSLINAVQAWQDGAQPGETLSPNPDGLIPGRVVRWVAGALVTLETCWLRPISLANSVSPDPSAVVTLRQADRFVARLSGIETSQGQTLPLYLVQSDQPQPTGQVFWGSCVADKTEWNVGDCTRVTVRQVDACHATADEGADIEVVLPRIADVQPNLHIGDVIAFSEAKDREGTSAGFVCVSDYTKSPGVESFQTLWGEVVESVTAWAASGCTSVEVHRVADCGGTPWPGGPVSYQVLLPRIPDQLPRLLTGNVIAFIPAPPEEPGAPEHVIVSDYTIRFGGGAPQWGVCLADSQDGADGSDTVSVQPTLDRAGLLVDPLQGPVTVYLPRRDLFLHSLKAGQIVAFETATDGSLVIQSDYSAGPRVEDLCFGATPTGGGVNGPERIVFDQRVGFRTGIGSSGSRSAAISLIGGAADRLWQTEAAGEPPQWSDTVRLARLVSLGSGSHPGAVVLDGNVGLAGPESPLGNYLLRLPDEQPDAAGRVLFITDWASGGGTCPELGAGVGVAKLRFSRPGISGSDTVQPGDLLEFEAGICVKWEDSEGVNKLSPPQAAGEVELDLGTASRGYLCAD